MEELQSKLAVVARHMGVTFTLKSSPMNTTEIFSEVGLLPALSKRADQLASLCFGYSLGASYEDSEKSLLGTKISFDTFTPDILRLFCIVDVLNEMIRNSSDRQMVALDELMYD